MLNATLMTSLLLLGALADDPGFKQAKALYTELEYEKALEKFQAMTGEKRPDGDRAVLHMWSGLCLAGIGDLDQAEKAFEKALALDRTLLLPVTASPKVSKMFAGLRDKAQATASAPPPSKTGPAGTGASPAGSGASTAGTPPSATASTSGTASTPAADRGLSALFIGGSGAAALGAVAVLGGAVLSGLAFADLGSALDRSQFQDEAQASVNSANTWMTGASVCYGAGALLFLVGTALAGVDVLTGD